MSKLSLTIPCLITDSTINKQFLISQVTCMVHGTLLRMWQPAVQHVRPSCNIFTKKEQVKKHRPLRKVPIHKIRLPMWMNEHAKSDDTLLSTWTMNFHIVVATSAIWQAYIEFATIKLAYLSNRPIFQTAGRETWTSELNSTAAAQTLHPFRMNFMHISLR